MVSETSNNNHSVPAAWNEKTPPATPGAQNATSIPPGSQYHHLLPTPPAQVGVHPSVHSHSHPEKVHQPGGPLVLNVHQVNTNKTNDPGELEKEEDVSLWVWIFAGFCAGFCFSLVGILFVLCISSTSGAAANKKKKGFFIGFGIGFLLALVLAIILYYAVFRSVYYY